TVSQGGSFVNPTGLALAENGDILVTDESAFGGNGGVIRVDAASGAQTPVASGGSFGHPWSIAVGADGTAFVADFFAFATGAVLWSARILALVTSSPAYAGGTVYAGSDEGGYHQTTIFSGGGFPNGIVLGPDGDILVANGGRDNVVRIDPATGAQAEVAS